MLVHWLAVFIKWIAHHDAFHVLVLDYILHLLAQSWEVILDSFRQLCFLWHHECFEAFCDE